MLKVQLFGKGEASYNGQSLAGFPGKQCHRLLCYLLLNREHPHPRERLAALFWAEYPTTTSRSYLRTCLYRLREALAAAGACADTYLVCEDGSLSFPNSGSYWLDVEAFEAAVNGCRDLPGDRLSPEQARTLESAVSAYSGDLLDGIYDDWCLYDRERLRILYLSMLNRLLAYHEAAGTYEQGLDYAQRILARDPARETLHRQMMRLYWLLGNPVEALAQYRSCVQVLGEELGAQPTAKTRRLYEEMLHNRFDPARWPLHRQNGLPERLAPEEARGPVGEQVLERLRRLEAVTQETEAELYEVRRLLEKSLGIGQDR